MATETSQTVGVTGGDISAASPALTPRVKVVEPSLTVLPDSGLAQSLIEAHPTYRGYNPYSFRAKLIQDDQFLDQYTTNVFENVEQSGQAPSWFGDPEQLAQRRQAFKSNLRNSLSKEMMTGEDTRSFIVNRETRVTQAQLNPSPVGDRGALERLLRERNSPMTADDFFEVSRQTGVGVDSLVTQALIESEFGTTGRGARYKNPLNWGNDDAGNNRGFASYRDGLLEAAKGLKEKFNFTTPEAFIESGFQGKYGIYATDPQYKQKYEGALRRVRAAGITGTPQNVEQPREVANPATKRPTAYNDMQIESIVKSNPAMFAGLGVTDEKGNLLYSPRVVAEKIGADPNLERSFVEAQYDMFQSQLTKSNNLYFNADDPDAMGKAWVVYSRFGPEALTQYVNFTQGYSPDLKPEQQLPQVRNALVALKSIRKDGRGVFQEIDKWFTEGGPAEYTGLVRSGELITPIAADLNGYSKYIHNYASPVQGLSTLITTMNPNQAGATNLAGEVLRDLEQGTLSKESKGFYLDVLRRAQQDDADFSMDDIFNTITVNSTPVRGEDGRYRYRFNYDNLPTQAKIAVNTLRATDNQYLNMVSQQSDGSYMFEPDRFDRLENKYKGWGRVMTETRALYNDDGTYAGMGEAPATGVIAQIVNGGSAFLFESGQFLADYGLAPGLRATKAVADTFGFESLARATEGPATEWMRDIQDKELINQVEGFFPKATVYTTEMGLYMAGLFATGGAASALAVRGATTAARLAESATVARQANQIYSAGRILGTGANTTALALRAQRLATGVKNREAWTEAFLRVEAGGALMELLGGQEKSIYNGGIVDDALSAISGGLIDWDTEKMYMASDRMTQFGVDALTGFALGNLIDNVWAGTKFGTNILRGRGGRGLTFDAGNFTKVDKPVFGPDYRRFFHNLNNDLQNIPIGSIEDTLRNMVNGRAVAYTAANLGTVHDVAARFHEQTGEVYGTLMQDIQNSIKYYDDKFGNVPMTQDAINARAQQIYDNAFNDLAENMLGVMRGGDNANGNRFAWGFVDALDQQLPTVKAVSNVKDGIVEEQYSLATATRLRSESPGRVIKSRGNNLYTVYEAEPNLWAVDLSTRLRKGLTEQSQEQWVETSMRRAGFDPKAPTDEGMKLMDELEQLAENKMPGRPFLSRSGDKFSLGYIESYDGKAFYLRDSETGELRKMKDREVLDFVARKGKPLPIPEGAPKPGERLLPEVGSETIPIPPSTGRAVGETEPTVARDKSGRIIVGGVTNFGADVTPVIRDPEAGIGAAVTTQAQVTQQYIDGLKKDLPRQVKETVDDLDRQMSEMEARRAEALEGIDDDAEIDRINEMFDDMSVTAWRDEVLMNSVVQLRRMGVSNREIFEAAYGDLVLKRADLEEKLAEVKKKKYSKESARKTQVTKIQKEIDAIDDELAYNEQLVEAIIRQTDDMVDNRVVEKVKKTKKAAKVTKELESTDTKNKDIPKC
jgi:hypothetical protein